jgi:repressor LexA
MMMARRRKKGLTERQKKILKVLEDFQDQNGYPPSIREICDQANISSTSVVNYYLDQLKEMDYIERDSRVSRGIRLLKPLSQVADVAKAAAASVRQTAQAMGELLQIPIVGRIQAGLPMPVPSSDFSYYDADPAISSPWKSRATR